MAAPVWQCQQACGKIDATPLSGRPSQMAGAKAPMETAMINTVLVPTDGSGHAN